MCCCNGNNHNHSHEHHHTHEDGHNHCHEHHHPDEHDHNHDHEHHHECCSDKNASHDEKTLKVLLVHWINHNKSHQENFLEWVDKCNSMEKEEVGSYIKKAVEFMDKANEMLVEAKKHM